MTTYFLLYCSGCCRTTSVFSLIPFLSLSVPRGDLCFVASAGSELWAHTWFLKFASWVNTILLLKWTHYRRQQYRQNEDGAILTGICHPQWASAASGCFFFFFWDDAIICKERTAASLLLFFTLPFYFVSLVAPQWGSKEQFS